MINCIEEIDQRNNLGSGMFLWAKEKKLDVMITVKSLPYSLNLFPKDEHGEVKKMETPLDYNVVGGVIEEVFGYNSADTWLMFKSNEGRIFALNTKEVVMISFMDEPDAK